MTKQTSRKKHEDRNPIQRDQEVTETIDVKHYLTALQDGIDMLYFVLEWNNYYKKQLETTLHQIRSYVKTKPESEQDFERLIDQIEQSLNRGPIILHNRRFPKIPTTLVFAILYLIGMIIALVVVTSGSI